jgi:dienelactone hydrolase
MNYARAKLAGTAVWAIAIFGYSVYGMEPEVDSARGSRMIAAYFATETNKLAQACLADVETLGDWTAQRESYRRQLREMLGLDPPPERTPLAAVVTGTVEHPDFVVEKLHFQSRPRLYVTANLYLPKKRAGPAPAVLYLCGHSGAKKDGVSYGNKTKYQHHAGWFARNGYVCMVIDSVQLGEIEGIHHGTYRESMWWWNARGYTPAGVEAWNAIRALDYLQSRPEVDGEQLGVTGRSGGGAYSWWLAALDDRVKAAVPVAGITNLADHVVEGCVEGHCDCMYLVNTYRWDYAQVAALIAPRPLLIANTDRDEIFPLGGVLDVYHKVRRVYKLHGYPERLGLNIAAGGHDDTQPLQVHAFAWFNEHLQGRREPIEGLAEDFFPLEQLKVFDELPKDEINSRVHETFVAQAPAPPVPSSIDEWDSHSATWRRLLLEKSFAGWPSETSSDGDSTAIRAVFQAASNGVQLSAYDFDSQNDIKLRLYLVLPHNVPGKDLEGVVLHPLDAEGWNDFLSAMRVEFASRFETEARLEPNSDKYASLVQSDLARKLGLAFIAPRGIGPTAWPSDAETHIRRRFMLLGQTLDGMRVWDTRRAIQSLRAIEGLAEVPLWIHANGDMAGIALYAALFEPRIERLELVGLSESHMHGPDFINVLRILDVPQAVAMVGEKSEVVLRQEDTGSWEYPRHVADKLGWGKRIRLVGDVESSVD